MEDTSKKDCDGSMEEVPAPARNSKTNNGVGVLRARLLSVRGAKAGKPLQRARKPR